MKRTISSEEPVRAYKLAQIVSQNSTVYFRPVNYDFVMKIHQRPPNSEYKAQLTRCICVNTRHDFLAALNDPDDIGKDMPSPMCTCGFYGVKDAMNLWPTLSGFGRPHLSTCAFLTVEFFGKVIEHEAGYRGEYQRVLEVKLNEFCFGCQSPLKTNFTLSLDDDGPIGHHHIGPKNIQYCYDCWIKKYYGIGSENHMRPISVAELRNMLGTEVVVQRWKRSAGDFQ